MGQVTGVLIGGSMYLNDEPISNLSDDKLSRGKFVVRLAQTIKNWVSKDSLVIGIYGPWGAGKSSVLNLLEKELNKRQLNSEVRENKIVVLRFDPWFFNSAEQLLLTFYTAIEAAVGKLYPSKTNSLKSNFQKYAKKLSFALSPEISMGLFKITLPLGRNQVKETPDQIRQQLVNDLIDIEGRVVVLIDNIDRLDPSELMLVFKLVKLCSDFPNFTYVLAFDLQQVRNILEEQVKIDSSFLEKIVQIDINLPKVDQKQVDEFSGNGINQIAELHKIQFEKNIGERFGYIYQNCMKMHITDLRTAKRYLNAISFSMPLVKDEVNYGDFLALEFIRVFSPHVYHEIPKYEKEFTTLDSIYIGGNDFPRKERFAIFAKIREWLNLDVDKDMIDAIEGILGFLFPTFGTYLKNPDNPTYLTNNLYSEYEREQNIASPTHFRRYFRLHIATTDIPTSFIRQFIELLNSSEPEIPTEPFIDILTRFKKSDQLVQFLDKLRIYVTEINAQGRAMLARIISLQGENFDWGGGGRWKSEALSAANLFILNSPKAPKEFEVYVFELVKSTKSLAFATLVVSMVLSQNNREHIPDGADKSAIIEIFRERLHLDLLDREVDIFTFYPDYFSRILSAWQSEQILNDAELAEQYVYKMLEQNELALGQLLSAFAWTKLASGKLSNFEFAKVEQLYNTDKLYELFLNQPNDVTRNDSEQYVIDEFVRSYKEKKQLKSEGEMPNPD